MEFIKILSLVLCGVAISQIVVHFMLKEYAKDIRGKNND